MGKGGQGLEPLSRTMGDGSWARISVAEMQSYYFYSEWCSWLHSLAEGESGHMMPPNPGWCQTCICWSLCHKAVLDTFLGAWCAARGPLAGGSSVLRDSAAPTIQDTWHRRSGEELPLGGTVLRVATTTLTQSSGCPVALTGHFCQQLPEP